ncbi:MAG: sulfotransferase family 2 domain-containing protein [Pseudomonadota bacterium]
MMVFHKARLVVFSIPRTGSTSLHKALRPHADIEWSNPPSRKHTNVRNFEKWAATRPRRIETYTRAAVMRDPLARIASWYRYRRRPNISTPENSALGFTFTEYVAASMAENPPKPAKLGNQYRFLSNANNELAVQELFCLEHREVMVDYFSGIFGQIDLPHRNAAPDEPLDLDPDVEAQFRERHAAEFDLFARVAKTGRLTL